MEVDGDIYWQQLNTVDQFDQQASYADQARFVVQRTNNVMMLRREFWLITIYLEIIVNDVCW